MRAGSLGQTEERADVPGRPGFSKPVDCLVAHCPAMESGMAELDRLKCAEFAILNLLAGERRRASRNDELMRHKDLLSRESDHRLMNGLQMVTSLLSMQSRLTNDKEAASQLKIAATRVATIGSVQRSLHALDHIEHVDLTEYLKSLCQDLSGMLLSPLDGDAIDVAGIALDVPSAVGSPLGFIVSELVTNSAKHASGKISVRVGLNPGGGYALSVSDCGSGLPAGFDPEKTTGLGMKIIMSLVNQIGGTLRFSSGHNNLGARFSVLFDC